VTPSQAKLMVRFSFWALSPLSFYLAFVLFGLPATILGAVGVIPQHPEGWLRDALLAYTLADLALSAVVVWLVWRMVRTWP
jgi:hypothetical protein